MKRPAVAAAAAAVDAEAAAADADAAVGYQAAGRGLAAVYFAVKAVQGFDAEYHLAAAAAAAVGQLPEALSDQLASAAIAVAQLYLTLFAATAAAQLYQTLFLELAGAALMVSCCV